MCRNSEHGGRRCPYDTSPERNAKRRAAYAAKKRLEGKSYNPHQKQAVANNENSSLGPKQERKGYPVLSNKVTPEPAPPGFVKLFHGTSKDEHLDSIAEKGLEASSTVSFPAKWYMLTTSYEQALSYAGGTSVVEFTVPEDALKYRHELGCVWPGVEHDVYGATATAYAPKGVVPNQYITGFYEALE